MEYIRVIPRDLFNESKLLKCMGQLILMIHDGKFPVPVTVDETGEPFEILLREDGYLLINNIHVIINDVAIPFGSCYNSKSPYPLFCGIYMDTEVFTDEGEFTEDFINYCKA